MHKNNKHANGYDLDKLASSYPKLEHFVFVNKYGNKTIDFGSPEAVKALNSALLKVYYGIQYWEFPNTHLCPPIPGRVEYIHLLNDLFEASKIKAKNIILDIGTGATCIYPLLGVTTYQWNFIATEIDVNALKNSEHIIIKNHLENKIEFRHQKDSNLILEGVLKPDEIISATMCNPPFFKNQEEADSNTLRKLKGLKNATDEWVRNFSGTSNELWYKGGEKAFLHNYLYQSSKFKTNCFWFTSLVSKKDLVKDIKRSLKKLGATEIKVIELSLGNKISRVVAWTFLSKEEQMNWKQ